MKKRITHQGKYTADITVSPFFTIDHGTHGAKFNEELRKQTSYNIYVAINNSHWMSMTNVERDGLLPILAAIEQTVTEYMVQTANGKTIESSLEEIGYV